jgi:hypothetical protein
MFAGPAIYVCRPLQIAVIASADNGPTVVPAVDVLKYKCKPCPVNQETPLIKKIARKNPKTINEVL